MVSSRAPHACKVLIIDDDPIVLEVARERLVRAGHEVLVREEALGTLQLVREARPDVILLDVMMPALNGERIALLLKKSERTRDVAVILHSSKPKHELDELLQQTGALGAIEKGGSEEAFLNAFASLLRKLPTTTRSLPVG